MTVAKEPFASATLFLRPRRSRQLLVYLVLVHLGALVVVVALPMSWVARLILLGLVLAHAGLSLAAHWWRCTSWSILGARVGSDGWRVTRRSGEEEPARLLASTFVGQRLIVLNFALDGWRRLSLPLVGCSLDETLMRRLRVVLRWGAFDSTENDPGKSR